VGYLPVSFPGCERTFWGLVDTGA
jgi:hypothetical protein